MWCAWRTCARAVGTASHVLQRMVDHANQRSQVGQKVVDFQLVQQVLAAVLSETPSGNLISTAAGITRTPEYPPWGPIR